VKHLEFTRVPTLPPIVDAVTADLGLRGVQNCFNAQSVAISYATRPGAILPLRDLVGLFEQFARARGDNLFGAFAAEAIRPESFGLFVQYAMQAPDLEAAINRTSRGVRLHQGSSTMAFRRNRNTAWWSYKIDLPLTVGRHHHAVHVLRQFLAFLESYLGQTPEIREVGLEAPNYGTGDGLEMLFGAPVRWSCSENYLSFPAHLLSFRRRPAANGQTPVTYSDLLRYARSGPPRTSAEKTEAALRICMASGSFSIDAVSRYLNLGPRTLQRRLAAESASFHDVLEAVRRERATELLRETNLPLKQISDLLGYSDPAHFTRAHRRWYDVPPVSIRRLGRAA